MSYLAHVITVPTPQSEPLPGREADMVANSAAGYVFPVDDFTRLRRFLILGSEGGSYYATERRLTLDNAAAVKLCIQQDGRRAVDEILNASQGAAPRIAPPLFALALAASCGDEDTRRYAFSVLPRVARTASHLFQFVEYAHSMRGWGRAMKRAISDWYAAQGTPEAVAYQVVKYRQRNGWRHADLLRVAHPAGRERPQLDPIYAWLTQGVLPPTDDPAYDIIHAFARVQQNGDDQQLVAEAIRRHNLTWEMIPNAAKGDKAVWEALFEKMPMTAAIRNLNTLTRLGIISPLSDAAVEMANWLADGKRLRRARIHPIAILTALMTYRAGKGVRGSQTWDPVPSIVDALDAAFDKSFAYAPRTGQRFYLGIDVSGSMAHGNVAGVPGLTPRMGAAAMAMAMAIAAGKATTIWPPSPPARPMPAPDGGAGNTK